MYTNEKLKLKYDRCILYRYMRKPIDIDMSINDDVLFETIQCSLYNIIVIRIHRIYTIYPYSDISTFI